MESSEFLSTLLLATCIADVERAIQEFESTCTGQLAWKSFGGRENNRGVIEVSGDPGRSVVERVTNGVDAVLEAEHTLHRGQPICRTPKEAATAWLNVPGQGLSALTPSERRALADRVIVRLLPGDGRDSRTIEIRDKGIGVLPTEMAGTILSLNESNKTQKLYLAGTYGQGGSSTLVASKYTLIVTRKTGVSLAGFTLARFQEPLPEEIKGGRYVYLTVGDAVLESELDESSFVGGTLIKIFGYDLSNYSSPLGPNSVYGLLNRILFDPVLPFWFDNQVHGYRRVIKGARNALNGAVDDGDEERRGPSLAHSIRMFHVDLQDFGRLGIEYWVLDNPTQTNKRPSAAFVNSSKAIVLTLQGQNQAELSTVLIRKDADLPHLRERLICHIDCNHLTPAAKRALFVSNREDARRGVIYALIEQEIVRALKSDEDLRRLNREAFEQGMQERDESALQQMRRDVARLLRMHGLAVQEESTGSVSGGGERDAVRVASQRQGTRSMPLPIESHDPPTYIRIVWDDTEPITFHVGQRRYIRIETDAGPQFHNPNDPALSRINFIVTGVGITYRGSTPLQGGRLRAIFEAAPDVSVDQTGLLRIELARTGLPVLSNERQLKIVAVPPSRQSTQAIDFPPFEHIAVEGPEHDLWTTLAWPENINHVASTAMMNDEGTLVIYYSTVFPKFANRLAAMQQRDVALAKSFLNRYKIWLAVHSLLVHQDQQSVPNEPIQNLRAGNSEFEEIREMQERCRMATLATLFAANEAADATRSSGDFEAE